VLHHWALRERFRNAVRVMTSRTTPRGLPTRPRVVRKGSIPVFRDGQSWSPPWGGSRLCTARRGLIARSLGVRRSKTAESRAYHAHCSRRNVSCCGLCSNCHAGHEICSKIRSASPASRAAGVMIVRSSIRIFCRARAAARTSSSHTNSAGDGEAAVGAAADAAGRTSAGGVPWTPRALRN